ncbi:MAG: hypothetical protein WC108_05350 [Bacteroidales bacterium]|jgi:hypothetical protein
MKLVKMKFSSHSENEEAFMATQREYTFRTELELKPDMVLWGETYNKFLHVTQVLPNDNLYFSPKYNRFSDNLDDGSYFRLAILEETGEFHEEFPVVTVIK